MPAYTRTSAAEKDAIMEMHRNGLSFDDIATDTGRSKSTVHYIIKNWRPPADRAAAARQKDIDRFHRKYTIDPSTGCWNINKPSTNGYGKVRWNGRLEYFHRASWMIHHGDIPAGKCVLHRPIICHNPSCGNPEHLYLADMKQNAADRFIDGTATPAVPNPNKGTRGPYTSIQERTLIFADLDAGIPPKQVADDYNRHVSTIYRMINERVKVRRMNAMLVTDVELKPNTYADCT